MERIGVFGYSIGRRFPTRTADQTMHVIATHIAAPSPAEGARLLSPWMLIGRACSYLPVLAESKLIVTVTKWLGADDAGSGWRRGADLTILLRVLKK